MRKPTTFAFSPATTSQAKLTSAITAGTPLVLGLGPAGTGKAQPVSEPVLTPSGFRAIGDLAVGDEVLGDNGAVNTVTGVYPQGIQPIWYVITGDQRVTYCTSDHLWQIHDSPYYGDGFSTVATTKDLATMLALFPRKGGTAVKGIYFPPFLPDWPKYLKPTQYYDSAITLPLLRQLDRLPLTTRLTLALAWMARGTYNSSSGILTITLPREYDALLLPRLFWSVGLLSKVQIGLLSTVRVYGTDLVSLLRLASRSELLDYLGAELASTKGRSVIKEGFRPKLEAVGDTGYSEEAVCISVSAKNQLYVTRDYLVTHNTYGALHSAAQRLESGAVNSLILSRPNIPAGRSLGFFPGDLREKLEPWLAPLTSVLKNLWGKTTYEAHLKAGRVVLQPSETIRGHSFDNSILVLDEAQLADRELLKAMTTRLGQTSQAIVLGDPEQTDIASRNSIDTLPLSFLARVLTQLDPSLVSVTQFSEEDIVRSDLVGQLIKLYRKEGF